MQKAELILCVALVGCSADGPGPDDGADDDTPLPSDTADPEDTDLPGEQVVVTVTDNPRMVLEKRFAITVPAGVPTASLRCVSPDDALEDLRLPFVGPSGELRLYGLLADLTYTCVLSDPSGATLWEGGFRTDPLPDGFPTFVVTGDAARASLDDGYTLFNHWRRGTSEPQVHRVMMIDGQGQVRWYIALLDAKVGGISARWLGDGQLVIGGGDAIPPGLYDLSGDISFQVAEAIDDDGYHHEALVTPVGWIVSLQGTDDVGPGGEDFAGFRIEATNPATGAVEWRFDSQTEVDAGVLPVPTDGSRSAFHANALSWVDDDPAGPSVWVTMRAINSIGRIDRTTGRLTMSVGPGRGIDLYDPQGAPLEETEWFWGVHAPLIEQGNTFTVFDNGGSRPGPEKYSRAAKFRLDAGHSATLEWAWTEPGWYEPDFGSVRLTTMGTYVIGSGHCTDCPPVDDSAWILEVDPVSNEVLWRFDFTEDSDTIYRAEPVDPCAFPNLRICGEAR